MRVRDQAQLQAARTEVLERLQVLPRHGSYGHHRAVLDLHDLPYELGRDIQPQPRERLLEELLPAIEESLPPILAEMKRVAARGRAS